MNTPSYVGHVFRNFEFEIEGMLFAILVRRDAKFDLFFSYAREIQSWTVSHDGSRQPVFHENRVFAVRPKRASDSD